MNTSTHWNIPTPRRARPGRASWGRTSGMTMLEIMTAMAIFTVVAGMLFTVAMSMGRTAQAQQIKNNANQEARQAMIFLTRELRQAIMTSVVGLPGGRQISYRVPQDNDGNGVCVDRNGSLETSPVRTIGPDTNDLNGDGLTTNQLIMSDGTNVVVLANYIADNEDKDNDGQLDAGEDTNKNGVLDLGIRFDLAVQNISVTIQTRGSAGRESRFMSTLRETIYPRNNI